MYGANGLGKYYSTIQPDNYDAILESEIEASQDECQCNWICDCGAEERGVKNRISHYHTLEFDKEMDSFNRVYKRSINIFTLLSFIAIVLFTPFSDRFLDTFTTLNPYIFVKAAFVCCLFYLRSAFKDVHPELGSTKQLKRELSTLFPYSLRGATFIGSSYDLDHGLSQGVVKKALSVRVALSKAKLHIAKKVIMRYTVITAVIFPAVYWGIRGVFWLLSLVHW